MWHLTSVLVAHAGDRLLPHPSVRRDRSEQRVCHSCGLLDSHLNLGEWGEAESSTAWGLTFKNVTGVWVMERRGKFCVLSWRSCGWIFCLFQLQIRQIGNHWLAINYKQRTKRLKIPPENSENLTGFPRNAIKVIKQPHQWTTITNKQDNFSTNWVRIYFVLLIRLNRFLRVRWSKAITWSGKTRFGVRNPGFETQFSHPAGASCHISKPSSFWK